MFTETLIAAFALGTIIGGAYVWAVMLRPLDRQLRDIHIANLRASRQRFYRAQVRRQHLGTPYIVPAATGFEQLMADISDPEYSAAGGSFRADLPDNVRAIGGSQ